MKIIEAIMVFKNDCEHKTEWVEAQFSEDEQFAFCTKCGTDLTKVYTEELEAKYPDYADLYEQNREELPF